MWKSVLRKLTGLGALAAVFAATSHPAEAQQAPKDQKGQEAAASQDELADANVVLRVDGMSCPFCAYGLEKRLLEIPAIEDLVIRVSDGLVQIRLADGGHLTDDELNEAVEQAGFSLREIRRLDAGRNR